MSALSSLFISHSSRDHAIAMEVGRRLRAEGYTDLFLDFDPDQGIPPDATGKKRSRQGRASARGQTAAHAQLREACQQRHGHQSSDPVALFARNPPKSRYSINTGAVG